MAPTRVVRLPGAENAAAGGGRAGTRARRGAAGAGPPGALGKRKACSPLKEPGAAKRAAFGDITNAINKSALDKDKAPRKPDAKLAPTAKSVKQLLVTDIEQIQINGKLSRTRQLQKVAANAIESVQKHFLRDTSKPTANKVQNGILKHTEKLDKTTSKEKQNNSAKSGRSDESDPSLYVSALDNISPIDTKEDFKSISEKLDKVVLEDSLSKSLDEDTEPAHQVPEGVADFDRENIDDPFQVSHYVMDIFIYLKQREPQFTIDDYLQRQTDITSWMRALLVDWMVEVQESFELNHETLYLAVKLVDLSLCRSKLTTTKEQLQLLGAASLFIASKFDERIPPLVDDFLYICDGSYTLSELLKMELKILREIDWDLGIPLSYRFLRRYARCERVSMPTLTLARFVLELCLMDYELVGLSDSKMASAALYIALRMKSLGTWTPTLEYYSGYTLKDILPVALAQNKSLRKKPKDAISTVRNKYSHKIFFSVAKVPLVDDSVLSS